GAGGLDGLLVLAGGDQVGQKCRGRLALGGGGGGQQFVAPGLAQGDQLVPAAVVGGAGRQRVLGQPGGVDVAVEVGAGGGHRRRPLGGGAAGGQRKDQRGEQGEGGSHGSRDSRRGDAILTPDKRKRPGKGRAVPVREAVPVLTRCAPAPLPAAPWHRLPCNRRPGQRPAGWTGRRWHGNWPAHAGRSAGAPSAPRA